MLQQILTDVWGMLKTNIMNNWQNTNNSQVYNLLRNTWCLLAKLQIKATICNSHQN